MCLSIPYKIQSIFQNKAIVIAPSVDEKNKTITTDLLPDLKIGDYVLVRNNMAIRLIPGKEALEIYKLINNS